MKEKFDYSLQPGKKKTRRLCRDKIRPYVSVITPYYNGSRYFAQTFQCVINQTFPWFEWIIVDDGSSPREHEYLEKFAQKDSRIRLYTKANGGPAQARNYAVERSTTELIVVLDADDLILATYIEQAYWALCFHPDAGWVYTDSLGFGEENYIWKVPFDSNVLKKRNFLIVNAMIRKKALLAAGGYDDREKYSYEDWRLWMQLLAAGYYPLHLSSYGVWYRRTNEGSLSITSNSRSHHRRAQKKVKEVAALIRRPVKAIEYPVSGTELLCGISKTIDFEETDYETGRRGHILLLIPKLSVQGAGKHYYKFVKYISAKKKMDVSIMTTVPAEKSEQQKYERFTDKIYQLPDFLEPVHYQEFLNYYVRAKCVNAVYVADSYEGYAMIPWIKINFPYIVIRDYVHPKDRYENTADCKRISMVLNRFIYQTGFF